MIDPYRIGWARSARSRNEALVIAAGMHMSSVCASTSAKTGVSPTRRHAVTAYPPALGNVITSRPRARRLWSSARIGELEGVGAIGHGNTVVGPDIAAE